jgi:hypothetical protein
VKKAPPAALASGDLPAASIPKLAAVMVGAGETAAAGEAVRLIPGPREQVETWLYVARNRHAAADKAGAAASVAEAERALAAIANVADRESAASQVAAAKRNPVAQTDAVPAGAVHRGVEAELDRIAEMASRGDFKKAFEAARAVAVDRRDWATLIVARQQVKAGDFVGAADTIAAASPGGFDWVELYVPVLTGAARAGRVDAAEKVVTKMGSAAPAGYRRLAEIRAEAGDKAGASALLDKAAAAAARANAGGTPARGASQPAAANTAAGVPALEQVAILKTRLRIGGDRAAVLAACQKLLAEVPPRPGDQSGYVPRLAELQAAAGDGRGAWTWVQTIPDVNTRQQATAALLEALLNRVAGPSLHERPGRAAGSPGALE